MKRVFKCGLFDFQEDRNPPYFNLEERKNSGASSWKQCKSQENG